MGSNDLKYFQLLKKEVAQTLQKTYAVSDEIENWKGQEISFLQDDLLEKVKGRLSEKWFYTHIKSNSEKLPRIDMLNILCEYCGYQNWNDFRTKFSESDLPKIKVVSHKKNRKPLLLLLTALMLTVAIVSYKFISRANTYQFCFVDSDFNIPITDSPLWIIWMRDNESPLISKCDSNGCFRFTTKSDEIRFIVQSPYYKSDTITRIVHNKNIKEEQIQLKTNDYALMIHLFSKSKVDNWKNRRSQLNEMFAENARIYQVYEDGANGMELYNKKEFINKMTTPTKSLKNIEIIETIYSGDKIAILRFKQSFLSNE